MLNTKATRFGESEIALPIFIFCQHRTGSTLLNNMMDRHTEVAMAVDEMIILSPWGRMVSDILGDYDLQTNDGLSQALDRIYQASIYGGFWKYFDREQMSKERMFSIVSEGERTWWGIVDAFLHMTRKTRGVNRVGAKNFAHYRYLPLIMGRYREAKCLFLVRDPVAMCASKLKSPGTRGRKGKHPAMASIIHLMTLVFFILEYRKMAKAFRRYCRTYKLLRVRYEDLVGDPERVLREVCEFCDLSFEKEMLLAAGKESSHSGVSANGVDSSRVSGGVDSLSRWEKGLIRWLTIGPRSEMGYLRKAGAGKVS